MTKSTKELISRQNEIIAALNGVEDAAEREALEKEYNLNKKTIETNNQEAISREHAVPAESFSLTKALREALHGSKKVNVREALTAAGLAGKAIETEIQDILTPLYANSALAKLGVKWYRGMGQGMGDISVPVMNRGNVKWEGETAAAEDGTQTFGTNVVLKPYRLTGYFDISEKLLLQDTIGIENAIKADAVNALADTFEATVLGNESGLNSDSVRIKPDGLFYNKTLKDATTFAKVVNLESEVEDNCVGGELKYLLGTKAKADFRAMSKSSKNTQLVMEAGLIDGTPTVVTQNVKKTTTSGEGSSATTKQEGIYAFGNFQNLACASWADLIFKVDDSVAYGNGKIRVYVTGYFDAKVLREGAFVYGNTRFA